MVADLRRHAPGAGSPVAWRGGAGDGNGRPDVARARFLSRVALALAAAVLAAGYLGLVIELFEGQLLRFVQTTGHLSVPSDLFHPWHGLRAMLGGANPYDDAVAADLQRLFYGAPAQAANDPHAATRFFYPPYIALPMAPFLWLPFDVARWLSAVVFGLGLAAGLWLWAAALGGVRSWRGRLAIGLLGLAFYPSLELLWLQQPSGFVVVYLLAAHAAATRRRYGWTGVLLALATIKPQVVALPGAGLLFWALWRRDRWPMVAWFGATMLAQLALAEYLVPGWLGYFRAGLARYGAVNEFIWLPRNLAGGNPVGAALITAALLALLAAFWWRCRFAPAESPLLLRTAALGFVVRAVAVPDVLYYNKTLLLVPILALALAGRGDGAVRRASAQFAALAVIAPAVIMSLVGWLHWLQAAEQVTPLLLDTLDVLHPCLPLLLLPATVSLCLERAGGNAASCARAASGRSLVPAA